MSAWVLSLEETEVGRSLALWLAILAPFLHAAISALPNWRHHPSYLLGFASDGL